MLPTRSVIANLSNMKVLQENSKLQPNSLLRWSNINTKTSFELTKIAPYETGKVILIITIFLSFALSIDVILVTLP